jgi:uncharacterized delta-60 repeat protein
VATIDVYARGVAVVGADKIVALGWVHDTSGNDFTALVRLGSDGSYDTTFGVNHDGRAVDLGNPNYAGFPDSLAVDNLGRILVGGSCGSSCRGIVARYTDTGVRDTFGFNANDPVHPGVVVINQGSDVSSLALATDGSNDILAADGSSSSDDAVIARIRPDGTLDATFGSGGPTPGVVESGLGCQACGTSGGALAFGVAAGPGGVVYATGQVSDPGGAQSMRLLRLTQAGNPDPGFGSGSPAPGVVAAPGGIRGVSVAVDSAACPVIVGYGLRSDQQVPNTQIVAARFTGAGQLDQAFNPAGATPGTAAFPLGSRALGETVVLQDDGKIVIGGEVDQFGNATVRNAVVLRLQGGGCGTNQPPRPTVLTGQASNLSSNGATLNGTVNPNGAQVSDCHFDYGTTTNYTSSVPCSQSPGAGTSPVAVSVAISGLAANTTYDYRVVATGPGGTSNGANQTLATSPGTPTTLSTVQVWGTTRGASITVPGSASGEHDEAQLSGANAGSASGSFTFNLYRQAAEGPQCTGTPAFTSTVGLLPVEGGGTSSDPVPTQLAPGTYYWTVSYSGDSSNQPTTSSCGSEVLTVQPPQPTTLSTVQVWGNSTRGASITVAGSATGEHDEAQLSGANAGSASGSFTFNLYRQAPTLLQCRGTPVFTSTVGLLPVEGGGTSSDPVPTQLAPGTYYWTVSYSGDGANQPTTSPCGSETLTVAAFRISPFGASISAQSLTLNMGCIVLPCTVRITITLLAPLTASEARQKAKTKRPVITLARGKVTIRKHGAQTVRLRLTTAGRRFAASHNGQVTVTAAVAMTIHGHNRVVNQRLKIKIRKPSKRKQH